MKKLALVALATFLAACSTTHVDLTVENRTNGTISVWVDRAPRDMVDLGVVVPGEPARRRIEVDRGTNLTVYVDNLKFFERPITDNDPDPVPLAVVKK